jgi:hypothetical protein
MVTGERPRVFTTLHYFRRNATLVTGGRKKASSSQSVIELSFSLF